MNRCGPWLLLFTLGAVVAWGCSPEVVIARDDVDEVTAGASGDAGEASGGAAGQAVAGAGGDAGGAGGALGGAGGSDAEPTPVGTTRLLADSVADFSLVQGERGWYYGFDNGTLDTFSLLTRTAVITTYVPASGDIWDCWVTADQHWTQIFQLGAHPNGTDTSAPSVPVHERAVRRWISSYTGDIRISGELAKIDVTPGGSNGVAAIVLVDGVVVYSVLIGGEDAGGLSYEATGTVRQGSTVDLVLDAHEGSDHHDLSRFTAVIERAPSHSG